MAWSNRFQVRDQEDAEHRDVRLATDRDRHALVRVLLFGFCTRVVSMLILPRREITNLAYESWSEFLLFGMVKSFSGAVRLATDRDHHALVRDLFTVHSHALGRTCQPS